MGVGELATVIRLKKFYPALEAIIYVERPSLVLEVVVGSIPSRVIPNTLKMVVTTDLLGAQDCGVTNDCITTYWLVSG